MSTRRSTVFWAGALTVVVGVLLHFPDFLMAERHGDMVMMAGMGMSAQMMVGMVLIVVGVCMAGWAVLPSRRPAGARIGLLGDARFRSIDGARLTRAHWVLISILTIGLVIDTMKPATLWFVVPGMSEEYGMSTQQTAMFPFTAIAGTVVGSLVWGYLADIIGRRATLMFSGVIFIGTSICGFMPSFTGNLVMCFFMGASAGGMLPTVYALTAESVPAKRRGPLIVLQSGLGATFGYLVASGAAALFIPLFGWRVLWLLGVPSGFALLVLCRWIPESPRFLLATGRGEEAVAVMEKYGITAVTDDANSEPSAAAEPVAAEPVARQSPFVTLFAGIYLRRSVSVVCYGLGWGVVNWGFITFLPTFLRHAGYGDSADSLLFTASLAAVPATFLAAYLYGRWSSRGSMILYSVLTVAVLGCFTVVGKADWMILALVALLLSTSAGMIAMLSPYSTEQYPTELRATGSGVAAAASKAGGMIGPLLLSSAPLLGTAALLTAAPLALATGVLIFTGIETSGRPLPEQHSPETARL
ncbi:MAG: MFS transporter, partial [Actinophytocola sp.]|uniref:MFS transporter n=1 Tax=Actinophytocola sp. TaxID=1872138 RepID=UPI001322610A